MPLARSERARIESPEPTEAFLERQAIAKNLDSARRHLAHALCNQGIDWDEACDEVEVIERRWRAIAPFNSDERMAGKLRDVAYPYEDM